MKFIDALTNVIRDEKNSTTIELEEWCDALNLSYTWDEIDTKKMDAHLKAYWVFPWYCTDQYVGWAAIYLDDELVGSSFQSGRKMPLSITFLNFEAANKVEAFIKSCETEQREKNYDILTEKDLYGEIHDFETLEFSGQILGDEGFYNGKKVKIIDKFHKDFISQKLKIKFEDGKTKIIDTSDLQIPLRVKGIE